MALGVPDLAHLGLVALYGQRPGGVAEQGRQPGGGRRVELAVVGTLPQAGQGRGGRDLERGRHLFEDGGAAAPGGALDNRTGLPQGTGLGVDGQGGFVAEDMACHGSQDEGELGMAGGHGDNVDVAVYGALFSFGHYDDRSRFVSTENLDFFGDVTGIRPRALGAITRTRGSAERSMCFLSSTPSSAIAL